MQVFFCLPCTGLHAPASHGRASPFPWDGLTPRNPLGTLRAPWSPGPCTEPLSGCGFPAVGALLWPRAAWSPQALSWQGSPEGQALSLVPGLERRAGLCTLHSMHSNQVSTLIPLLAKRPGQGQLWV